MKIKIVLFSILLLGISSGKVYATSLDSNILFNDNTISVTCTSGAVYWQVFKANGDRESDRHTCTTTLNKSYLEEIYGYATVETGKTVADFDYGTYNTLSELTGGSHYKGQATLEYRNSGSSTPTPSPSPTPTLTPTPTPIPGQVQWIPLNGNNGILSTTGTGGSTNSTILGLSTGSHANYVGYVITPPSSKYICSIDSMWSRTGNPTDGIILKVYQQITSATSLTAGNIIYTSSNVVRGQDIATSSGIISHWFSETNGNQDFEYRKCIGINVGSKYAFVYTRTGSATSSDYYNYFSNSTQSTPLATVDWAKGSSFDSELSPSAYMKGTIYSYGSGSALLNKAVATSSALLNDWKLPIDNNCSSLDVACNVKNAINNSLNWVISLVIPSEPAVQDVENLSSNLLNRAPFAYFKAVTDFFGSVLTLPATTDTLTFTIDLPEPLKSEILPSGYTFTQSTSTTSIFVYIKNIIKVLIWLMVIVYFLKRLKFI